MGKFENPSCILITGASSGLGAALADAYAAPGIRLLLTGRNLERLKNVSESCRAKGAEVETDVLDVTDSESMARWITEEDKDRPIDVVIANAGISAGTGGNGMFDGETAQQSRRIFEANMMGVLNTIHPALPLMAARGHGQIAIISSLASFRGIPGAPSYSGSKAAVKTYGEALRGAMQKSGVGVSVICPGYIRTPMTDVNDFYMPQIMTAEKAASIIKRRLKKNPALLAFPNPFAMMVRLIGALPCWLTDPIFSKLPQKNASLLKE